MLDEAIKIIQDGYFALEERYYSFADVLEEKFSIPIYEKFIKPIEEKGIPSFPLVLLLLLLLVTGSLLVLFSTGSQTTLNIRVFGKAGNVQGDLLDGANVQVLAGDQVVFSQTTRRGRADFQNPPASVLTIRASKAGFKQNTQKVDASRNSNVRLELQCEDQAICEDILRKAASTLASPIPKVTVDFKKKNKRSELSLSDPDPESSTGKLLVLARDSKGNPLSALARVFDFETATELSSVDVSGGSGLVLGLAVGRKIYINMVSDGYAPHEGKDDPFVIQAGTNKLKIILLSLDEANGGVSAVTVVDRQGKPVTDAAVSIRSILSPEEIVQGYSDENGLSKFEVGNGTYYAVVSKQDYITNYSSTFKAGKSAIVVLSKLSEVPLTELSVTVLDEDKSGVPASVTLSQRTDFGAVFVLSDQNADSDGKLAFPNLPRGVSVEIHATYSDLYSNASLSLAAEKESVTLLLTAKPFFVKAYAFDPLAKSFVENPVFVTELARGKNSTCFGHGCSLQVKSGEEFFVNVTADGYTSSKMAFLVYEGIDSNVTLYIVNLNALKDSFVQWVGLFDGKGRALPSTTALKPGHSYQARVQLFSKDATTSGIVFLTGSDGVYLNFHQPAGFFQKGGYAGSCSGTDLKYGEYDRAAWADVAYNGDFSSVVAFNFTIEPEIALDLSTRTRTLSLQYRSYITRQGSYIRNPFDSVLLTNADSQHASGCDVPYYSENFTIKSTSTTCVNDGCVGFSFLQAGLSGSDGFTAKNQVVLWNESYDPLNIIYAAEFFNDFGNAKLSFQGPSQNVVVWNITTPIIGDSLVATGKKQCDFSNGKKVPVNAGSFEIDLAELKKCSNFGLPLKIEGIATARVLESGSPPLQMRLNFGEKTVSHLSTLNIDGFGIAANDQHIVEGRLYQPRNVFSDSETTFKALTTGACTADQVISAKCDPGAINATFRVTSLAGGSTKLDAASTFFGNPVLFTPQGDSDTLTLKAGESFQATAQFLAAPKEGSGALLLSATSGSKKTTLVRNVNVGGEYVQGNNTPVFPPGWDTCNGFIDITYRPEQNPPFNVGKGCTDLGFKVSTLFPADAVYLNVSLPDYGNVLTRVSKTDGSHECYEICEVDPSGTIYGCESIGKQLNSGTSYIIRYNPELRNTCPKSYKVLGNTISSSEMTLEFAYTGETTAKRNVTLHVLNDKSEKSLFVSPIYTFYTSGSSINPLYPQLWAVTNLKQLGPRNLVFSQPSGLSLKFEGPGSQLVSIHPGGGPIQVFEASNPDKPVFFSTDPLSPVRSVSRYAEAQAVFGQQIQLNTPAAQEISNILSESLSQNAFLQKSVAEGLSASIPRLSDRTAYWRSNDAMRFCQKTQACVSSYFSAEGCCKDTLDAWKNQTVKVDYREESCTFCNNTFNPSCTNTTLQHLTKYPQCTYTQSSRVYNCDQRCTAKAILPPNVLADLNALNVQGNGISIDLGTGTRLKYGEQLGGKACEVEYSSLNAFLRAGSGSYTFYTPSFAKAKLFEDEVEKCKQNGSCPLVFIDVTPVPGLSSPPTQVLQCFTDSNGDGLWQSSEAMLPSVKGQEPKQQIVPTFPVPYETVFSCPTGSSIAVSESLFFTKAFQNGKIVPRQIATSADMTRCNNGLCPLMINPATGAVNPNTPLCFTDQNGNGFWDDRVQSEINTLDFAVPAISGSYQCPAGTQLAVASACLSSCNNFCYAPNCDPSLICEASGVKRTPSGQETMVFNNWLNQSEVALVQTSSSYLSRGKPFLPAGWFADVFTQTDGKPVFKHSYVVNSKTQPGVLGSLKSITSVKGCGPNSDSPYSETLLPAEGVFEIRDYNVLDGATASWLGEAEAIELPLKNYLGARSDVCRKPQWNSRLCETTFVDVSPQYGGCFNSILQYSPSDKRLGVDVPLVRGLGYGIKDNIGYGISPGGQAFALLETGQKFSDVCGDKAKGIDPTHSYDDKHKYNVDKQTLHHWKPDGQYDTSHDFYWQKDLGCNKSCGCKKGGGYGLLMILVALLAILVPILGIVGILSGTALTVAAISVGVIGMAAISTGSSSGAIASAVSSSIIQTASTGAIGPDCMPWGPFGDAMVYACKGLMWQISGG